MTDVGIYIELAEKGKVSLDKLIGIVKGQDTDNEILFIDSFPVGDFSIRVGVLLDACDKTILCKISKIDNN